MSSGRIEHLFRKERHGGALIQWAPGDAIECISGFGIAGDVHAHRLSPRQILITLQSELDALRIAPGALHENMVISSNSPELFRPGSALITRGGVEIRFTMFCEPCKLILPVVRDLASMVKRRGILGYIEKGGVIQLGDELCLQPDRYPALPESAYEKFLDFVATIPVGKVVRYSDVTIAMGVADSFVRAIPGYIKRSSGANLPVHRIVTGRGGLLPYVPCQADKLTAEGVHVKLHADLDDISPGTVALKSYLWQG